MSRDLDSVDTGKVIAGIIGAAAGVGAMMLFGPAPAHHLIQFESQEHALKALDALKSIGLAAEWLDLNHIYTDQGTNRVGGWGILVPIDSRRAAYEKLTFLELVAK